MDQEEPAELPKAFKEGKLPMDPADGDTYGPLAADAITAGGYGGSWADQTEAAELEVKKPAPMVDVPPPPPARAQAADQHQAPLPAPGDPGKFFAPPPAAGPPPAPPAEKQRAADLLAKYIAQHGRAWATGQMLPATFANAIGTLVSEQRKFL